MEYCVIIPTSGLGSRLGQLTNFSNKTLVNVGLKPVISHIVEQYDDEVPIVVLLGHFGDHVKQFLNIAYEKKEIHIC